MQIKSLKLENIRSYVSQEFIFPEGSIILSGDIGSGKSTVLHAIEFALFGISRSDLTGMAILRNGKNTGGVELKLILDNKEVIIKRSLKRVKDVVTQDSGFIIVDGSKIDGTAVELKARILELLGYPRELLTKQSNLIYRYTVYTPQEEMKRILFDDKEHRIDTLRKVFGIDKYKKIRENVSLYLKELNIIEREFNAKLSSFDEKSGEKEIKLNELEECNKEAKLMTIKMSTSKDLVAKKKIAFDLLSKDKETYLALLKDIGSLQVTLTDKGNQVIKNNEELKFINSEIKIIKEKTSKLATSLDYDSIVLELNKKQDLYSKTSSDARLFTEKLAAINKTKEEIIFSLKNKDQLNQDHLKYSTLLNNFTKSKKDKSLLVKELDKIEAELKSINAELAGINVKKKSSEEVIQDISSIDKCPTCYQDVDLSHKEEITKKESAIISSCTTQLIDFEKGRSQKELQQANLKKEIDLVLELEKKILVCTKNIEILDEKIKDVTAKEKQFAEILVEEKKITELLQETNKIDLNLLNLEILSLRESQKNIIEKKNLEIALKEKEARVSSIDSSISLLKSEITSLNEKMVLLKKNAESYSKLRERLLVAQEEYDLAVANEKMIISSLSMVEEKKRGITDIIALIDKDLTSMVSHKLKLQKISGMKLWLSEFFYNLMISIEKQVMAKIYQEFNEMFQSWFGMLIEDGLLNARLDDEFTPIIEQNGYEIDVNFLSGGEKTALALAYRLSLNKVINDVVSTVKTKDLLILDEPTDGFSSEQLDKLRDVLDDLSAKQLIIVSHETKIESFVENVLKIAKSSHESHVI